MRVVIEDSAGELFVILLHSGGVVFQNILLSFRKLDLVVTS